MSDGGRAPVLVIGFGNELRGDDGAGLAVARALRDRAAAAGIEVEEEENEPTRLIDRWRGRHGVVLIDAVVTGEPGSVHRLDVSTAPLPRLRGSASTHAVGLEETIELARTLGALPTRLILYAVSGRRFEAGAGLSGEVANAVAELTERVLTEAGSLVRGRVQTQ